MLGLKPASPSEQREATLYTAALADALKATYSGRVFSVEDVKAVLDAKAQQQLMGCDDPRCAMDVSNLLAADVLVTGTSGELAGAHHAFLTMLDGKNGRVVGRASHSWGGADLKGAMKQLAVRALAPDAKEHGDQLLPDLRTAVAIEELDDKGAALSLGRVAACVQGQLVEAGVPVVSADQVKRIKMQLIDPQALLSDVALDALDAGQVDVIIRGTARYAEAGRYHTNVAMRGTLSFEVVKVDTGEVIASVSTAGMQRAPSVDGAIGLAADAICNQVKPELQKALLRRVERGTRVVIEAKAATSPALAQALTKDLEKMKPLVTRTKLVRVDDKGAVLDVVVRAGDGIALALAMEKAGQGDRVMKASAGTLVLKE